MVKVGKLWHLEPDQVQLICPGSDVPYVTFTVIQSECGNFFWGIVQKKLLEDINKAFERNDTHYRWCNIESPLGNSIWESLRLAILNDTMPEPTITLGAIENNTNVCVCDIYTLMRIGCPSTKGNPCSSI